MQAKFYPCAWAYGYACIYVFMVMQKAFLPLPLYICLMNTSPVKQGLTYIKGMRVNEFGNKQVARLRPSK